MLIPCERLKFDDFHIWAALEKADLLRGRRIKWNWFVNQALDALEAFAAAGPCYAGVSWGKDSVVLAHLISMLTAEREVSIPCVWVKVQPIFNPYCPAVRDAFSYPLDYSEIESWCEETPDGWLAGGTLERGFEMARNQFNAVRHISGIRAQESAIRRMRVKHWGVSSPNTCAPLADWTTEQVFAYLAINRLPVHPNYAMLGGGRYYRNHIRVASLGGIRGREMGRAEWEYEYYWDLLKPTNRLKDH